MKGYQQGVVHMPRNFFMRVIPRQPQECLVVTHDDLFPQTQLFAQERKDYLRRIVNESFRRKKYTSVERTQTKQRREEPQAQYMSSTHYGGDIKKFGLSIQTMKQERRKIDKNHLLIQSIQPCRTERRRNKGERSFIAHQKTESESKRLETSIERVKPVSIKKLNQIKINTKIKILVNRNPLKPFRFTKYSQSIKSKVNKFREFLFALNYSNGMYRDLQIEEYSFKLKYYVGNGNNSNLIRSLMKRRYWFQQTTQLNTANFIWTQIKKQQIFLKQDAQPKHYPATQKHIESKKLIPKDDPLCKIFTFSQQKQYIIYNQKQLPFSQRLKHTPRLLQSYPILQCNTVHNHLPSNGLLGNKKAMFCSLQKYCVQTNKDVFDYVPLTYIIDSSEVQFMQNYSRSKYWIMKPGQFSNRGNGIELTSSLAAIRKRIQVSRRTKRSLILQQYLTRPLLYHNRKFDIRTYMLLTCHNNRTKAYWYQEGYIRTSSSYFSLQDTDAFTHLTNDAVQQHSDQYGRFEQGNKLSYADMQRYLDTLPPKGRNLNIETYLTPLMKHTATLTVKSTHKYLCQGCKQGNFQLFGLDFIVDQAFKPWLLEVNTNPCLELSSVVLERLIPYMVQNALRIGLDTIFPPPSVVQNSFKYNVAENALHYNKFELIFDEERDGRELEGLKEDGGLFDRLKVLQEDKTEYVQEGDLVQLNDC